MAFRSLGLFGGSLLFGSAFAQFSNLSNSNLEESTSASSSASCAASKCAFDPNEFKAFRLISSRYESHDSRRFYFALDEQDQLLNMPCASCIVAKFTDADGKDVIRPYTPISNNNEKGRFELLIKKYPKSKMGTHVFSLKPGEQLLVKGPFIKFKYAANQFQSLSMIAGGTGIAPMYQVIREVLENPKDKTKMTLIYANNARKDILLANELCEYQKTFPNFNLYLTLLDVPHRWLGGVGYINEAVLKTFLPKPEEIVKSGGKHKILVCGPPPMMKAISGDKEYVTGGAPKQGPIGGLLKEMGYTEDMVFKF